MKFETITLNIETKLYEEAKVIFEREVIPWKKQ